VHLEKIRPVAQLAERRSPKPQVGGSIPSWPAIFNVAALRQNNMSEKSTTQASKQDLLKWIAVAVIVAAGVYANAYFSAESLVFRVIGLLVAAGLAVWIAVQTEKGSAFLNLCLEARTEIRKVVWPTRQETTQTTMIVLVVVFILGIVLWLLDTALGAIISRIIG
jgi:preprotein translocase subunit SecE